MQTDMDPAQALMPGETVLWTGKPNVSKPFGKADVFLLPFSILWLGFALFWTATALSLGGIFGLFGVPFVLIGLYLAIGRFVIKTERNKHTRYMITNKRVCAVVFNRQGRQKSSSCMDIKSIQNESVHHNGRGIGTISFGALPLFMRLYLNTGMECMMASQFDNPVAFFDIDNVQDVYAIYQKVKYPVA